MPAIHVYLSNKVLTVVAQEIKSLNLLHLLLLGETSVLKDVMILRLGTSLQFSFSKCPNYLNWGLLLICPPLCHHIVPNCTCTMC